MPSTHIVIFGRCNPLVRMSASWAEVRTLTKKNQPTSLRSAWAQCFRISMCLARSHWHPSMTLFPHSMHAEFSSYTTVGSLWVKWLGVGALTSAPKQGKNMQSLSRPNFRLIFRQNTGIRLHHLKQIFRERRMYIFNAQGRELDLTLQLFSHVALKR
jgi:hypothetical protein